MNYNEFITEFTKWRAENNYPRRDECREILRKYRDEDGTVILPRIFSYILAQDKPSMFLDSLFKKGSHITSSDPKNNIESTKLSDEDIKDVILRCTYEYIKTNNRVPELRELNTGYNIKKYYTSEKELFDAVKEIYDVSEYVLNESIFTSEYHDELVKEVKKYNRFVITSAVVGKQVNKQFLGAIKNYCERNKALCLVLPCQDVHSRNKTFNYQMDPELKDFKFVYNDLYLCDNLYISNIRVSAKMINPNHGLSMMSVDASTIIGNPKQDLTYVGNAFEKRPRAIMSTGAITVNDYSSDLYLSDRINRISELNHVEGAIVVEIQDDNKIFHFRQIQAGPYGEIDDLGKTYSQTDHCFTDNQPCLVMGDAHFTELQEQVFEEHKKLIKELSVKDIVLHDVISAGSISHHNNNKFLSKAIIGQEATLSLQEEADTCADKIIELLSLIHGNIYIVRSNHHEHIHKFLDEGRYINDPINKRLALELAMKVMDGDDAFKYLMMAKTDLRYLNQEDMDRIIFLNKMENKEIYGVTISNHGHLGSGGTRGNLQTYHKAFEKSVSGHSHVGQVFKSAYCVGTMSILNPKYVDGLSAWTHTSCLISHNGNRQLINFIDNKNGKYTWRLDN